MLLLVCQHVVVKAVASCLRRDALQESVPAPIPGRLLGRDVPIPSALLLRVALHERSGLAASSARTVTFHNQRDFVFFRHYRYNFKDDGTKCKLQEIGPRTSAGNCSRRRAQGESHWLRGSICRLRSTR